MTPKEQRIEQVKNKITESEKDLRAASQTGPWIMLFIGALITTGAFYGGGLILGIFGILIIIIALIWSNNRKKDEKSLKDTIFQLKGELYNLEKES
jgi:hypothetical protein